MQDSLICHRSLPISCLCSCCSCPKTLRTSAMAEISMSLDRPMLMADKGYHIQTDVQIINHGEPRIGNLHLFIYFKMFQTPPRISSGQAQLHYVTLPRRDVFCITITNVRGNALQFCIGTGERWQLTCPDVEIGNYETENQHLSSFVFSRRHRFYA